MLNNISIMGRLTKDPELRYTNSQKAVASFTLAVDRDYSPQGGDKQTDFIPCVAWSGTAEFVEKWFHKGDLACVTGRLQMRDWTDREEKKHTVAEVVAGTVYFGGAKKSALKPEDGEHGELPF